MPNQPQNDIDEKLFNQIIKSRLDLIETQAQLVRYDNQSAIQNLVQQLADLDESPDILNEERTKYWYEGLANHDFGITIGNNVELIFADYGLTTTEKNIYDNYYVQIQNGHERPITKSTLTEVIHQVKNFID